METTQLIDDMPERLLNAQEVAEILNVSKAYAYKLMSTGDLRSVVLGSARRVRPCDLDDFIDMNLSPPINQS